MTGPTNFRKTIDHQIFPSIIYSLLNNLRIYINLRLQYFLSLRQINDPWPTVNKSTVTQLTRIQKLDNHRTTQVITKHLSAAKFILRSTKLPCFYFPQNWHNKRWAQTEHQSTFIFQLQSYDTTLNISLCSSLLLEDSILLVTFHKVVKNRSVHPKWI